ncbi:diaminopimelate epimerase [Actinomycetospora straminea]|uniref:Diaminopimelate epimerase n=1 Tax=Actinomycetospora straminea TaxID=663607 RepID=A0ABP9EUE8_9PSEU|nr:diaminopimelate epimerase [Actinomycetospora straminea]MDD7931571.1 diaminopimelate epimerase [Actinomycetospora straminea]
MEFVKGHGTENDFVVLPDPDGVVDLDDGLLVRALCHRRRGIGADGVLRVVRTDTPVAAAAQVDGGEATWFMDYRNADGSLAEMCGNGIRVFARYLVAAGLVAPGAHPVATRAGTRWVTVDHSGPVTVDMGPAELGPYSTTVVGGVELDGVAVDVGNPHLACVTTTDLEGLDLARPPRYDTSLFPRGVNVEVLTPLADGAVRLRVHERGSGETRSCGTGTVAGAVAALHAVGRGTGTVTVDTPGGTLLVGVDGATTSLTGPAELVARGTWGAPVAAGV